MIDRRCDSARHNPFPNRLGFRYITTHVNRLVKPLHYIAMRFHWTCHDQKKRPQHSILTFQSRRKRKSIRYMALCVGQQQQQQQHYTHILW